MVYEQNRKFTVIVNDNYEDILNKEKEKERDYTTPPNSGYSTNPMYEKLLKYQEMQKKKRFTVEDLLSW